MNWIIEVLVDMIDPEVEYPAKWKEVDTDTGIKWLISGTDYTELTI